MKRGAWIVLIAVLNPVFIASASLVTAKYGNAFLAGGVGARSTAMGNAMVSAVEDATAMYWNPAALVLLNHPQVHGFHAERFAGIINTDFLGAGIPVGKGVTLGIGFYRLGLDAIPVTRLLDPSKPLGELFRDGQERLVQNVPVVDHTVRDQEMAFLFSCGRRASPLLNWGAGIKLIAKQVGAFNAFGLGFDFGLLLFPYRDIRVGILLQDATTTVIAWNGKRKESVLPSLHSGVCYPVVIRNVRLVPAFDFEVTMERLSANGSRMSIYPHFGLEAECFRHVCLRAGMDRGQWTVGSGIALSFIRIDYAFVPDAELGSSQRLSASVALGQKKPR